MALELELFVETHLPVQFACADGTGIEKGSLLKIADGMVASITAGDTDPIIGVAAGEKIAGNGQVFVSVYTQGIFKAYAGLAGVTVGLAVISDTATGAANELVDADVNSENIAGRALSTAADGVQFVFQLNPFSVNLA